MGQGLHSTILGSNYTNVLSSHQNMVFDICLKFGVNTMKHCKGMTSCFWLFHHQYLPPTQHWFLFYLLWVYKYMIYHWINFEEQMSSLQDIVNLYVHFQNMTTLPVLHLNHQIYLHGIGKCFSISKIHLTTYMKMIRAKSGEDWRKLEHCGKL